jgi:hypothetical protein
VERAVQEDHPRISAALLRRDFVVLRDFYLVRVRVRQEHYNVPSGARHGTAMFPCFQRRSSRTLRKCLENGLCIVERLREAFYIGSIIVHPSYISYGITHFTKILVLYTVAT